MSYFEQTKITDSSGAVVNPASDDTVILLRRLVKLLESQAVVDSSNRQRITLDSLGPSTAITTTVPVSGTVTATVANATIASGGIILVDQRYEIIDRARMAYNIGIRNNLSFS